VVRVGVGISTRLRVSEAVEEAVGAALSAGGIRLADAALVFATAAWGPALPDLAAAASRRLDCETLAGASVSGLIAAGQEVDHSPALAVLALAGIEARALLLDGLGGREADAGPALEELVTAAGGPDRTLTILLVDSLQLEHGALLSGLHAAGRIAGLGAVEAEGGRPLVWCGGRAADEAAVGLVLSTRHRPRIGVSSACRPRSGPHRVTRARGYWITELDGRPALDVYRAALPGPLAGDLGRATRSLMVALPPEGRPRLDGGGAAAGLRVRPVVGVDPSTAAFSTAAALSVGSEILLVALDASAAREDLRRLSAGCSAGFPTSCAIYLGCRSRGRALFGHAGIEAADLASGLADSPLIGAAGAFQLASESGCGAPQLFTHAGVLAVL